MLDDDIERLIAMKVRVRWIRAFKYYLPRRLGFVSELNALFSLVEN